MSELLFRAGFVCTLVLTAPAALAGDQATAADRAVIDACVKAAAPERAQACIGRVSEPCMDAPGGQSTAGMNACLSREIAVWDERLNADYAAVLKSEEARQEATRTTPDGTVHTTTGADLLRATQRAWIVFRDAKCSAAQLPMEGGTGMGQLGGDCLLQETARQDLWLTTFARP